MARAIDPICGMTVDTETAAARATYQSTDYYFCSESCAQTFRANPERYADVERHEPPYTHEGGMTTPKFGSAGSGGAEYELPPERHDRP